MRRLLKIFTLGVLVGIFLFGSLENVGASSRALYVPRGPSLFPVIPLRQQMMHGPQIQLWSSPEEIIALFVSGEAEAAFLPVTLGAAIHQRGFPLLLMGVIQWDLFAFLTPSGEPFSSLRELENASLYLPFGRGTTADVLVRSSLRKAGLVPEVNVRFLYAPPQEIVGLLGAGKARYAVLPEPFVTLAVSRGRVERGLSLRMLWQEEVGEKYHLPVTGLFVSRRSYDKNPGAFRDLERQYLLSLQWSQAHLAQAVDFLRRDLSLPQTVLEAALEKCDFTYRSGPSTCKEMCVFYEYLCERAPGACSGVPEKAFFYP